MRSILKVLMLPLLIVPANASAIQVGNPYLILKASLSLPVQFQGTDKNANPIVKVRTLSSNDIINLALGRSLTTKPDPKTEVLALAADDGTPGTLSQLIVFNPMTQAFTATIWTQSNVTLFSSGDFASAVGVADLTIPATTLGTPALNGFSLSTLAGGGNGKGNGTTGKAVATALSGHVKFTTTDASNVTTTIDGIVTAGKFKAGGKVIAIVQH